MNYKYIDEVPQDLFTSIQEIDSGTFSDIFSAVHLKTNSKVALKILLKNNDEEEMNALKLELEINKTLHHPFICKYFTDIETEHLKIIVMELIEGENALDYVNKTRGLPLQKALNIFSQLIIAIEYLHNEAHITHRDLKLENVMIDKYDHIRLIDFGFSSLNVMMTTCCGSIPYCAPEILSDQKYTNSADIWSLGIILFALIDGNLPFYHANINTLALMICQNEVKFSPNFRSLAIQDLLQRMLTKDPGKRIKIDEIKRHPVMAQQRLLQIDYRQLLHSVQENPFNFTSQKFNEYKIALAKSSTCIQFNTGFSHPRPTSLKKVSVPHQQNSSLNPNQQNLSLNPNQQNSSLNPNQQNSSLNPNQQNSSLNPNQQNLSLNPNQQNSSLNPNQQNLSLNPNQQNLNFDAGQTYLNMNFGQQQSGGLDDEIRKRKDFAFNLNKAIESALLNSLQQKNIPLQGPKSFSVGNHFTGARLKRRKTHATFKNGSPLFQPNVNNNPIFGKD